VKCPRCKAAVTTPPDDKGIIVCEKCGARLRSRPSHEKAGADKPSPNKPSTGRVGTDTIPTGKLKMPRSGSETLPPVPSPPEEPPFAPPADAPAVPFEAPPFVPPEAAPPAPTGSSGGVEALLDEIRQVRRLQEEMLAILRESPRPAAPASAEPAFSTDDAAVGMAPVVRSRRRKTVLLIDDDAVSRTIAVDALERAEVPVRTVSDGNAGLAAIAQEKPDVIVLELGIDGAMPGKDVVNVIKATMEWVDAPIVLYTRVPIEGQKEARIVHGADELVQKGPGAADQLVSRVIAIFRKG